MLFELILGRLIRLYVDDFLLLSCSNREPGWIDCKWVCGAQQDKSGK